MSVEVPEILVVARSAHLGDAVWHRLAEVAVVVGRLPPRLALVRPRDPAQGLPSVSGLVYVAAGAALGDLGEDLAADEQLFVDAWRTRLQPKQRPGDGVAWDEPGFTPPDLPQR